VNTTLKDAWVAGLGEGASTLPGSARPLGSQLARLRRAQVR
jgi:hypothetical protein